MNEAERVKYEHIWTFEEYRRGSPGERRVREILELAGSGGFSPRVRAVLDAGCGPGRAALLLHRAGFDVSLCDIARNALDPEVRDALGARFTHASITELPYADRRFDLYWSCDVLEHLPQAEVGRALREAARVAEEAYLEIALFDDVQHAKLIGQPLHLTLRDAAWWEGMARLHWPSVDALAGPKKVILRCARDGRRAA